LRRTCRGEERIYTSTSGKSCDPVTTSLGVDPGIQGYLCLISEGSIIDGPAPEPIFWPMPVLDGERAGEGDDIDRRALLEILREASSLVDIVVSEAQQGFPGLGPRCLVCHKPKNQQGVASTFKTGHNVGILEGMAFALGLPLVIVKPTEWKPVWGLSADKSLSVAKAKALAPDVDFRPFERKPKSRVPDHNKCESYILAKHGIRLLKGKP
jgi:hypothetical protein